MQTSWTKTERKEYRGLKTTTVGRCKTWWTYDVVLRSCEEAVPYVPDGS